MDEIDKKLLETVFGVSSKGKNAEERSRSSKTIFVRSLDQIAFDSPKATGRRLTAKEALDAYGWDVLSEVGREGSALLCAGSKSAGNVLNRRRKTLNLQIKHVANRSGLSKSIVERAEATDPNIPIQYYERIARSLGLDERYISVTSTPKGNEDLAVRLKTAQSDDDVRMTPSIVSCLAESAWVAGTQSRLEEELGIRGTQGSQFSFVENYTGKRPPYMYGYNLANDARTKLGYKSGPLELSLREICEQTLGIPVIQVDLGEKIAGATLQVISPSGRPFRAIAINTNGKNRDVFMRRSTLAHELGHLLYDPPANLNHLRVDGYDELEQSPDRLSDPTEQRANAFGVEFIAPHSDIRSLYESSKGDLGQVINSYGLSFTASRYHVWNSLERRVALDSISASTRPDIEKWEAIEQYTVDYHPLGSVPPSRAGRFSAVVILAAQKNLISWDSAAEYLSSDVDTVRKHAATVLELFEL